MLRDIARAAAMSASLYPAQRIKDTCSRWRSVGLNRGSDMAETPLGLFKNPVQSKEPEISDTRSKNLRMRRGPFDNPRAKILLRSPPDSVCCSHLPRHSMMS